MAWRKSPMKAENPSYGNAFIGRVGKLTWRVQTLNHVVGFLCEKIKMKNNYGKEKNGFSGGFLFVIIGVVSLFLFLWYLEATNIAVETTRVTTTQPPNESNFDNRIIPEVKDNISPKTQQIITQSNTTISPIAEEKSTADIVAEWQDRIAQVTCMFFENTGLVTAKGSATIVKLSDHDGSVYMTAITNRHMLVDNNYSPHGCIVGIYGKGSRIVENPTAFMLGELEDYGYINLDKASNINETRWEEKYSYAIKNCSSSNINLGDSIVILGYPEIGTVGGLTVTRGIISGLEKNYYVTDAKIDHGNSGGAAILLKDDCYLGVPSSSTVGSIESMGRILKASFVIN